MNTPTVKIAPCAFDSFVGTQDELDSLVAEIQRLVETGEIFERARPITEEEFNELPEQVQQDLARSMEENFDQEDAKRRTLLN